MDGRKEEERMEYNEWEETRKRMRKEKALLKKEKVYKYNRVSATITDEEKKWYRAEGIMINTPFIRYLLDEYMARKEAEKKQG